MRRVVTVLSALAFAFAVNGEALAKDGKKKPEPLTAEQKAANKEHAQERKVDKADAGDKSGPLIRLHGSSGSHSKPDSSWLNSKRHKDY